MAAAGKDSASDVDRLVHEGLIRTLHALLSEGGVSGAALRLGLPQPQVSRQLKALREITGDELLVRVGNRMVLTERAESLVRPVGRLLADLSLLQPQRAVFDPAAAHTAFRLATYDFLPAQFYAGLAQRVTRASPGSVLAFRGLGEHFECYRQLGDGDIDAAITIWPELPAHLRATTLLGDELVCLVRRGHPLARGPFDLDVYSKSQHVTSLEQFAGEGSVLDALLQPLGISLRTAVRTQFLGLVPAMLQCTDMVFTTGRLLASQFAATHALVLLEFPKAVSLRFSLVWHERTNRHSAMAWFRKEIVAAARSLTLRRGS